LGTLAYFAVGFALPLVLTNGVRSKTLRGFSPIDLVFGSSQIYLAEKSLLSISRMNSEVPARFSAKLWAFFAVGFALPEAKQLGALAPFDCLKK